MYVSISLSNRCHDKALGVKYLYNNSSIISKEVVLVRQFSLLFDHSYSYTQVAYNFLVPVIGGQPPLAGELIGFTTRGVLNDDFIQVPGSSRSSVVLPNSDTVQGANIRTLNVKCVNLVSLKVIFFVVQVELFGDARITKQPYPDIGVGTGSKFAACVHLDSVLVC